MNDDIFGKLIAEYLDTVNPEAEAIGFDPQSGSLEHGIDHAFEKHNVTEQEVRQVLFEIPSPEEKRSKHEPKRTLLWGYTRKGRELTVCCRDGRRNGKRHLALITAFDEAEADWRRRR